jgi:hypothetical protein
VEDAPALDPIAKYDVYEKEGAVYVKAPEAWIKANRRPLDITCPATNNNEKVLVIGGYCSSVPCSDQLLTVWQWKWYNWRN